MQIHEDKWLASVLGMPCFKAELQGATSVAVARAAIAEAASDRRCMVFAKVATEAIAAVAVLTKAGFNPVDVSVTFVHSGSSNAAASDEVTVATPSDADDVASLAGRCFTYSRFHADPHVRKDVADAVKREWARNACKGRAAVTYIVRYGARIAGFLAVLTRSNSRGKDAVIDLISVDPAFQGKGLGRALSTRFIQDWRGQADRLVVGTQAANIPAMQLYEGLGFRIHETAFVLHAHLENGKVME